VAAGPARGLHAVLTVGTGWRKVARDCRRRRSLEASNSWSAHSIARIAALRPVACNP
jgi:hypothetical protein